MLNGTAHDKHVDHWSLGCLVFEVKLVKIKIINNINLINK